MGNKKLANFYVLEHTDHLTVFFSPENNGAEVNRQGRGQMKFSQKQNFDI